MKMNNRGFHVVEVILVIVFIGIACAVGFVFMTRLQGDADSSSKDTTSSPETSEVVSIGTSEDLDTATLELDSMSLDDSSDSPAFSDATTALE